MQRAVFYFSSKDNTPRNKKTNICARYTAEQKCKNNTIVGFKF
jgi:hypothetical protein